MIEFTVETEIERPVPEVFAFATDPAELPRWQTNTVLAEPLTEGPLRVGSRLREVHRGPGGRELESVVGVTELEPNRTFGLHVVEGVPIHGRLRFEPAGQGTRVRFDVHGQPTGALRLLQPLLKPALRRQFRRHLADLKRALEKD